MSSRHKGGTDMVRQTAGRDALNDFAPEFAALAADYAQTP